MRHPVSALSAACLLLVLNAAHAQTEPAAATTTTTTTTAAAVLPAAQPTDPATVAVPVEPQLIVNDVRVGTGAEAVAGKTVEVNYTGWLYAPKAKNGHGKQFDTSVGRGLLRFPLGAGKVIKGWEQGVAGMKEGGKRTLIIPSALGYGAKGAGSGVIPPNADLIFDVELVRVR
jgi:FKBP-type peptidyl-prolyl cis-trans isomerase FkpA